MAALLETQRAPRPPSFAKNEEARRGAFLCVPLRILAFSALKIGSLFSQKAPEFALAFRTDYGDALRGFSMMKKSIGTFLFLIALIGMLAIAPSALAKTVVLDPGHGGIDRGGIPGQKYPEKVVALDVAQRVQSKLRAAGYQTVMTRTGDYFVGLRERCQMANQQHNAVFVSIHTNSDPRGTGIGIETYCLSRQSLKLATAIHREVLRASGTPDRGVRSRRRLFVLRNNHIPAVLVEIGFLTNAIEGPKLANSSDYRDRIAAAIARGIGNAF